MCSVAMRASPLQVFPRRKALRHTPQDGSPRIAHNIYDSLTELGLWSLSCICPLNW